MNLSILALRGPPVLRQCPHSLQMVPGVCDSRRPCTVPCHGFPVHGDVKIRSSGGRYLCPRVFPVLAVDNVVNSIVVICI